MPVKIMIQIITVRHSMRADGIFRLPCISIKRNVKHIQFQDYTVQLSVKTRGFVGTTIGRPRTGKARPYD